MVQALAGERHVHARADREDVAAAVDLGGESERLLGRDVRGRADGGAHPRGLDAGAGISHARHAEVEHLHLPGIGDEDVARLDVAVDDPHLVTA